MAKRKKREASFTGRAIIPDYIDADTETVRTFRDGRVMESNLFMVSEEVNGRIMAGYTCGTCLEDYDAPLDQCRICGSGMGAADIEHRGRIKAGPSTTLDEERSIMNEMREKESWERAQRLGIVKPTPNIIVPRDAS